MAEHDAIDRSTAQAVAAHLAHCPACAAAVAEEQLAVTYLRALPLREPPPGLEARLLALPSSAAAPMTLSPVLAERFVWVILAAATALLAWGVWQARFAGPGGLRPGALPPVAEQRGRGEDGRSAGAEPGLQAMGDEDGAARAGPTAVARLRPRDLRVRPDDAPRGRSGGRAAAAASRPVVPPLGQVPPGSGAPSASSVPLAQIDGGAPDQPSSGVSGQSSAAPKPGRRTPTSEATAVPATAPAGPSGMPTASACTTHTFSVRVMADVAGGLDAQCAGCDGQYDERDRALLAANLPPMPVIVVGIFSASEPERADETTIESHDARYRGPGDVTVTMALCLAADHWPVVAQLHLPPNETSAAWSACPSTGFEAQIPSPDAGTTTFALRQACPRAAPPMAGPTAEAGTSDDPAALGTAATGGGPAPPATAPSP